MAMANLDSTFAALAHPTRRAILARLAESDATVGELAAPFNLTAPTLSKHLKVLQSAELIEVRKDAQWRRCRLARANLDAAQDWIGSTTGFWEASLDRLEALAAAAGRGSAPAGRAS